MQIVKESGIICRIVRFGAGEIGIFLLNTAGYL